MTKILLLSFRYRFAAVLLDAEARSVSLDADPSHGHLREPLVKVISFLRSMDVVYTSPSSWRKFYHLRIGQEPYGAPDVFSFFQPDYAPAGVLESAGLVAPESGLITGDKVTSLLDGLFTTVKFGLTSCNGGFGDALMGCPDKEGVTDMGDGLLTYSVEHHMSLDATLDDISLMLTAGRLGTTNRGIIRSTIANEFINGDREKAIRIAQQLVLVTPEFHSTGGLNHNTGAARNISGYTKPPKHSYKSVVYFLMSGGVDSYSLLVPKDDCKNKKNLYGEYKKARGNLAIEKDDLLDIDATGSDQICNDFGVNEDFSILKSLYDEENAMFFANTGVLCKIFCRVLGITCAYICISKLLLISPFLLN